MGCGGSKHGDEESAMEHSPPKAFQPPTKPPKAIGGSVKVHIGPLELGADGVAIKPKFNIGVQGGTIYAMAGVRDVRDGLAAEALAMAMKSYSTDGATLVEVLQNVKAQEPVPALDDIIAAVPDIMAAVLQNIGVDITSNCSKVEGVVYVYVGAGISAGVFLGWLDTNGYAMVGVEGRVASAAALGLTVKAGLHESKKAVRVTVFLANVGFDVIVQLKEPAKDKE